MKCEAGCQSGSGIQPGPKGGGGKPTAKTIARSEFETTAKTIARSEFERLPAIEHGEDDGWGRPY